MNSLIGLLKEYAKMKKVYLSGYEQLSIIRDRAKDCKYNVEDLVNLVHVSREISKLANDLRKEADGIARILEGIACVVNLTRGEGGPIRATLATGSPSMTLGVKLPHRERNPEAFQELMNYFGIELNSLTDRAVRPHWPAICEIVSVLAEEGKPLPPGIDPDATYPTYSLRIKSKCDLDELIINFEKALIRKEDEAFEKAMNEK